MLTKKAHYALKALVALAREGGQGPVLVAALSEKEHIPKKFLELILLELKHHGIVRSKKGRGGGYALGRPPQTIALGQVIRLIDGPLAPLPCASYTAYAECSECDDPRTCGIRLVMKQVRDAVASILDHTTLADVVSLAETVALAGAVAHAETVPHA